MLLRLVEREVRARQKRVARSAFTPEPGKMNADQATAEALRAAVAAPGEGRNYVGEGLLG